MARDYCDNCNYPQNACVCYAIQPFQHRTEVIVLQHPSEVKHQKNSVRLLKLVMPELAIWVGESATDFAEQLTSIQDSKPTFVVYPTDDSCDINSVQTSQDCRIIVIDGTWRKAYKMWQLNPWLQQYPVVHLAAESISQYTIRKAKRSDSLSTLEAVGLSIQALEKEINLTPLNNILAALVEQRIGHMSDSVKQRY
ncbi:tRNA-uridine aminocarboxypropyltransferase [Shewanella marina]|uniref:tRNA-uridine aminocarboxypropyltransferase n=1 Tax=Shewanella marina TaxID=487319 RepID=UPI000470347D|nr:tRNA-uridine aminocarboxypropyltransferase [Shewanella marina]